MSENKLYDFALKWLRRFRAADSDAGELYDRSFADDCLKFGFEMNFGVSLSAAFPGRPVLARAEVLEELAGQIDDIKMLGSALFSKWRYFTYWSKDKTEILRPESRRWFSAALVRLAELAAAEAGPSAAASAEQDSASPGSGAPAVSAETTPENGAAAPPEPAGETAQIPQRIERIEVLYKRQSKTENPDRSPSTHFEYFVWNYSERLLIDRATESLCHEQQIGSHCKITHKYEVVNSVSALLDAFDPALFFRRREGNPADAIRDSLESKDYQIRVSYRSGDDLLLTGSFDQRDLPEDFPEFAEEVLNFMCFCDLGEILDEGNYSKRLRCPGEYIFLSVVFEPGGKCYYYRSNEDNWEVGDVVLVPVRYENRPLPARVEAIEYFSADRAPFPVERTKFVIRRVSEDELREMFENPANDELWADADPADEEPDEDGLCPDGSDQAFGDPENGYTV